MALVGSKSKFAGFLFLTAMFAGIFSVAPAVDSAEYLSQAAANSFQVIIASSFQFLMALVYLAIAIIFYPILKRFGPSLSAGFLSFRILAACLVIIGTLILMSILALSQEYVKMPSQEIRHFEILGALLKIMRDHINHVFMILSLCIGNFMLYLLLLRSRLIPLWLSIWGLLGNALSVIASLLILFQQMEIITTEYLLLNAPTAIQELILAMWLMLKGFDKKVPLKVEIQSSSI